MKKLSLVFIIVFSTSLIYSQEEWGEPVLISTMLGYNDNPDFCIDTSGIIHCVWSHEIATNYRKIYYSKSEDEGETWTEPEDVSLNTYLWMAEPHLAIDTENNLHLSYDYNAYYPDNMHVLFRKFNDTNWSEPDTITTGMPGSDHNKIVIDNNDRIYVFWYKPEKIYYRYFENNTWSEIFCPYNDSNDLYFLAKVVSDNSNNLHCIGRYVEEGQSVYDNRAIYFKYNYSNILWQEKHFLSENTAWAGSDICMDNNQLPNLSWREPTTEVPPYNDATFYTYFNGTNWMPNEIVVEDPKYQTIAIDSYNRPHITNQEKTENGVQLVHYQKLQDDWEGQIVDTGNNITDLKLIYYKNKLFLLYDRYRTGYGNSIIFSKYNIPVNIPENTIKYYYANSLKQNYPNPFDTETTIHFYLNKSGYTTLKILDLQGRLVNTLINGYKAKGGYSIKWNGKDKNGKDVKNGLYLYRLQVDKRCMTRSLQLVK